MRRPKELYRMVEKRKLLLYRILQDDVMLQKGLENNMASGGDVVLQSSEALPSNMYKHDIISNTIDSRHCHGKNEPDLVNHKVIRLQNKTCSNRKSNFMKRPECQFLKNINIHDRRLRNAIV